MARRRPELVFHLAAQADVRVSVARPAFDATVNIVGSLNVLEGARQAEAERVVFAASGGTLYGEPAAEDLPVRESHPQQPLSPYGVSKKAVIDYLVAYRELHALEFCALALANVYGPRQDPHGEAGVVAIFAERIAARRAGHDLRGRRADPGLRLRRRRRRRLRAGRHPRRRARLQHRDRPRDVGQRAPRHHGGPGRRRGRRPSWRRCGPGELLRSSLDIERAAIQLGWRPWTELADGTRAVLEFVRASGSAERLSGRGPRRGAG